MEFITDGPFQASDQIDLDDGEAAALAFANQTTRLSLNSSSLNSIFVWEEWDGVIRNKNGSTRTPVDVNIVVFVVDCICCIIGLPLNFYMAATILCKKRLKRKAKNMFQMALALCDIFTLSMALIRIVYYFHPSEKLCLVFTSLCALPYNAFFFNLLLSLIDRYVAITHPIWHRNKMSIRFVILWQILLILLLVLAVKWVYIGQFIPLNCEVQFVHTVNSQAIFAIELVLCFAFHIAGYSKAKQLLRSSSRTIGVKITTNANPTSVRFVFKWRQEEQNEEIEMKSLTNAESSLEQTKNNIRPTLSSSIDKCIGYFWLFPYFRALIGLHVLVYVVITVARNNKDFSWPFSASCFTHTTDLAQWYG